MGFHVKTYANELVKNCSEGAFAGAAVGFFASRWLAHRIPKDLIGYFPVKLGVINFLFAANVTTFSRLYHPYYSKLSRFVCSLPITQLAYLKVMQSDFIKNRTLRLVLYSVGSINLAISLFYSTYQLMKDKLKYFEFTPPTFDAAQLENISTNRYDPEQNQFVMHYICREKPYDVTLHFFHYLDERNSNLSGVKKNQWICTLPKKQLDLLIQLEGKEGLARRIRVDLGNNGIFVKGDEIEIRSHAQEKRAKKPTSPLQKVKFLKPYRKLALGGNLKGGAETTDHIFITKILFQGYRWPIMIKYYPFIKYHTLIEHSEELTLPDADSYAVCLPDRLSSCELSQFKLEVADYLNFDGEINIYSTEDIYDECLNQPLLRATQSERGSDSSQRTPERRPLDSGSL